MISTLIELNQKVRKRRIKIISLTDFTNNHRTQREKIIYTKMLRSKHRGYINPSSELLHLMSQQDSYFLNTHQNNKISHSLYLVTML